MTELPQNGDLVFCKIVVEISSMLPIRNDDGLIKHSKISVKPVNM